MYLLKDAGKPKKGELRVQLLGSGTILREVIAAAELLDKDFGVTADIWSCPSFNELRRDGFDAERWNRCIRREPPRKAYVEQLLEGRQGPAIAATDYMRAFADQIRAFVPMRATPCSAPTASAAATTAPTCAASSRSTATTSPWPR